MLTALRISAFFKKAHERLVRLFHAGEHVAHSIYFLAVAIEGHGVYATMGGVLFFMTVLGVVLGEEDA